jgi:prevent-host-death family protein
MKVGVASARNQLPKLIKQVEDGGAVTICHRGVPVVDLVPTKASTGEKPKFGTLKGRIEIHDPTRWKPMTEEELEAFLDERG